MRLKRAIEKNIIKDLEKQKVIILFGARQVGKTTMVKQLLSKSAYSSVQINGEQQQYATAFSQRNLQTMLDVVGNNKILFIDEAQAIQDIGLNIKILHDAYPELKIILTGSSSFDLASKTKEPLTGRTITYQLHPIAMLELAADFTPFELKQQMNQYLIFGSYPEIITTTDQREKIKKLTELSQAYLYKDVLQLTSIKHTHLLLKLLQLIALQIGNLVSLKELSNALDLSFDTIRSYLEILEKAFVIKSLSGFSKNPRKEISKMDKIYFVDLGIRNAVINNYNNVDARADTGGLWENFLFMERTKYLNYTGDHARQHFWRKYSGAEMDYVETKNDEVHGYEFKWSKRKSRSSDSWITDYPFSKYGLVNRDNYLDFILVK